MFLKTMKVLNFHFAKLCRRWKKVSLQVRFVQNILKSTVKFMNGLIFSLITLEEQPPKNKQSKLRGLWKRNIHAVNALTGIIG